MINKNKINRWVWLLFQIVLGMLIFGLILYLITFTDMVWDGKIYCIGMSIILGLGGRFAFSTIIIQDWKEDI